ncbi:MAG: IPT/TIG domain-containing protein, partial [Haloferacaceae archaeon]
PDNQYQLRGRVVRADDRTGVPGLRVEVIDNDHVFDDELGETRTDGDGRFVVTYAESDYAFEELYEREPEIYVRLRDRENSILYTEKDARPFPPASDAELEIVLDGETLADHYAEPLRWEVPDAPLFPEARLTVVGTAVERFLADPGTERHATYMRAARCPLPPLLDAEGLMQDAHGVLVDRPGAVDRFRRSLDGLVEESGAVDAEGDLLSFEWLERTVAAIDEQHGSPDGGALGDRGSGARVERTTPPAVDPDASRTLVAAAVEAAPDRATRRAYVGTLLDGFRGLKAGTDLYATALRTLEGEATPTELRAAFGYAAAECGPDDGPIPEPFPRPEGPLGEFVAGDLPWLRCVFDAEARRLVGRGDDSYTVAEVDPPDACPGETIIIRGSGFGTDPGRVTFSTASGSTSVRADSWTDTEITVTVPDDARTGSLSLDVVIGTGEVCGRFVVRKKHPTEDSIGTFAGGTPSAYLYVDGRSGDRCVAPGERVAVSWRVSPSDADVSLSVEGVGSWAGLAADGSRTVRVPDEDSPRTLSVDLEATSDCGTVTRTVDLEVNVAPTLSVLGMEVTQGVQTFSLSGGSSNTLDTVAGKDTVVRVYVAADRGGFDGDRVPDVTGRLRVGGLELAPINGSTPTGRTTRNPTDPFITARPAAAIDRGESDHSLNFEIPASAATGSKLLRVDVVGPAVCGRTATASASQFWTWTTNRALPVRFVRIRDDRAGGSGTRPSVAEARFTVGRAFDLFPSPPTDVSPAARPTMNTSRAFGTDDGLDRLLDDLDDLRSCNLVEWLGSVFGDTECDDFYWVGLTDSFNRGLSFRPGRSAMSCIFRVSDGRGSLRRIKTAHELGHSLSFRHVNRGCGGSAPACPSGSTGGCFYAHPNGGTLQEVPFDPFWHVTVDGTVRDFMSYGCRRWASADSWNRLENAI